MSETVWIVEQIEDSRTEDIVVFSRKGDAEEYIRDSRQSIAHQALQDHKGITRGDFEIRASDGRGHLIGQECYVSVWNNRYWYTSTYLATRNRDVLCNIDTVDVNTFAAVYEAMGQLSPVFKLSEREVRREGLSGTA
jgi:hypothetical protein